MNMKMLYCYFSGQHEYGVQCEPGEIFLRCIYCGRRSAGWELKGTKPAATQPVPAKRGAVAGKKRPAPSTAPAVSSL